MDIVLAGKALYVGISRWPLEALKVAEKYLRERDVPLFIYQGKLNMLDREPLEEGILDFCEEKRIGFISFSPLAQGLLTDRYLNGIPKDSRMTRRAECLAPANLTPEYMQMIQDMKAEADAKGKTIAELALAWVLKQKAVTSVLVGASSKEQLAANIRCIR